MVNLERLKNKIGNIILLFKVLAYIWLTKGNQHEFRKHPKIKWLDGKLESPTYGLPSIALSIAGPCKAMGQQSRGWRFEFLV